MTTATPLHSPYALSDLMEMIDAGIELDTNNNAAVTFEDCHAGFFVIAAPWRFRVVIEPSRVVVTYFEDTRNSGQWVTGSATFSGRWALEQAAAAVLDAIARAAEGL